MNVTILGINGFLSTAIAKYCNKKNSHLVMHGIGVPEDYNCDACYQVNLAKEELDYTKVLSSDLIVYAVGAGIQSNLNENNSLVYNLNVTAPVNICNSLKEKGFKGTFVTFGSYFEIGENQEAKEFTESEMLSSTLTVPNDYCVSKRMLSRFVTSYTHGFTHWHFILPTIYGKGENPNRLIPYVKKSLIGGLSF